MDVSSQQRPLTPSAPLLYPPRAMSGIQPTTAVHLGHYFGAIRQHIEFHHRYPGQSFFVIADYHALTRTRSWKTVYKGALELVATYLAVGLDPRKATFFRQSD